MRIFFDINCGPEVQPREIEAVLNRTADYLTSTENWFVKNCPNQGIIDQKED
tara:strand:+ start:408 stop:563 length:156 start_codon:yes stop_codon:yes gene_type:complete